MDLARKAVRLKDNSINRRTLATAYAEAGRFDEAVAEQMRAIEGLRVEGHSALIPTYQPQLDLFRQRRPWRL